jgi:RNA polymerase sigma-70 factor (ECF subfamily)
MRRRGESREPGVPVGATAFVSEASRSRAPGTVRVTASAATSPAMEARLREFVDGEYRQVVATVELVCGSLATAEDSVQEALARAWERDARGEVIDRLAAWVTTVSLNLAKSQMRRWKSERRAQVRLTPLQRDLPDAPSASGDAHAVREALRALPRRQREVTALRYYLGLDVAGIAEWLGIGEGTVKAQLFKARQALALALRDDDLEDDDGDD